jgi:cytochrome c1
LGGLIAFGVCGCMNAPAPSARTGGDATRGRQLVRGHGCAACHTIPGIGQPRGVSAPALDAFARRSFIAGVLPNTPANLARWIVDPTAIDPLTAMPALGLTQAQAQDVVAFLYTLD